MRGSARYWVYAVLGEVLATVFFLRTSEVSTTLALVYATLTVAGTAIVAALLLRRWRVAGLVTAAVLLAFLVLVAITLLR